ncbi:MAG TPA: RNA polymerase sigma factor [Bacillota bacterium]|nr:RNA polymerase sigma factor [Bacillota bacterium]
MQHEEFADLYQENSIKVYRLALGLSGNAQDAEEITQEAFLRAYRSFDTFRGASSFFTWIYRITINVAHDFMKQRTRLPMQVLTEDYGYSLEELVDGNPVNDPEYEVLENEMRYHCLFCLTECLPINQRIVFCLAVTLELPQKVVTDIMDCSVSVVKTTLYRAKQRVAGYLQGTCQFIKKSNPCNCRHWVKFGIAQGWIEKGTQVREKPKITVQAKQEIIRMHELRAIYQKLNPEKVDEKLGERIKEGIENREWAIFSQKSL